MIDTIVIRIHDLKKHDTLIRRLDLKRNPGFKLKTATINKKQFEKLDDMGYNTDKKKLDIMELTGSGRYLIRTQRNKMLSASSHYEFAYQIDYTKDFIELNFSVPKYLYGTNVLMFVQHFYDRDYQYYYHSKLENNIKEAPKRVLGIIKDILKREFILENIDYRFVEINRVDVCWNQIFRTKEEAIIYFNLQKRLKKKYSREDAGGKIDYDTSFSYVTQKSSSKIYHKGTEYKKNDAKAHKKYNESTGTQHFNINKIQTLADRILRYELTLRSGELNYLFKHKIFRKDCPIYNVELANYKRIGNTVKRNDRIAKKIGELPDAEKAEFKRLNPYEKITKEDRGLYKYVSNLIERKPYFMMETETEDKIYNSKTERYDYDCVVADFSERLLKLCLEKLMTFISEFKIKELPDIEKVSQLIDQYNSKHKSGFQKSDMLRFYCQLIKCGSFKEASKESGYCKATLYRYINRFKQIGIMGNSVRPNGEYSIPVGAIDLKEYHAHLLANDLNKLTITRWTT